MGEKSCPRRGKNDKKLSEGGKIGGKTVWGGKIGQNCHKKKMCLRGVKKSCLVSEGVRKIPVFVQGWTKSNFVRGVTENFLFHSSFINGKALRQKRGGEFTFHTYTIQMQTKNEAIGFMGYFLDFPSCIWPILRRHMKNCLPLVVWSVICYGYTYVFLTICNVSDLMW